MAGQTVNIDGQAMAETQDSQTGGRHATDPDNGSAGEGAA
jgi:hypothetical protein